MGGWLLPVIGICERCDENRQLRESHLGIPRFAARWLKEQPATLPHMFAGSKDDVVITQDVSKQHLLCDGCEETLSKVERRFAEEIFHVVNQAKPLRIRYGPWLATFCASAVWRALIDLERRVRGYDAFKTAFPEHAAKLSPRPTAKNQTTKTHRSLSASR